MFLTLQCGYHIQQGVTAGEGLPRCCIQSQTPQSSRTYISHRLPLSFQSSQFPVLRSVLCHWDGDLSSEGHWDAQMCVICAAPSVGGPWAAEQKPRVVSTQQVPLAPVTTHSRGVEAGKWTCSCVLGSPADPLSPVHGLQSTGTLAISPSSHLFLPTPQGQL